MPRITTATGGLTLGARFVDKTTAITSNTTLGTSHSTVFADATSGNITLTLPAVSGNAGLTYSVYKTDASTNTLIVDGNASETIDGSTTETLGGNAGKSMLAIVCTGSEWRIRELHDVGTFTLTGTGYASGPTGTADYSRNGRSISLEVPDIVGTSNSAQFKLTGLPSFLYPAATTYVTYDGIFENSQYYAGYLLIGSPASSGEIQPFFRTGPSTSPNNTYTASGNKGIAAGQWHYHK